MPRILVDGLPVDLPEGALLTAALGRPPVAGRSLAGGPRGPLCGMGQCFECQLQVDDRQALACLTRAVAGMVVVRDLTDAKAAGRGGTQDRTDIETEGLYRPNGEAAGQHDAAGPEAGREVRRG